MRTPRSRQAPIALLVALTLGVSACGDGDSDDSAGGGDPASAQEEGTTPVEDQTDGSASGGSPYGGGY